MYESFPEYLETISVLYGRNFLYATSSTHNKYQIEYIHKPAFNKR